MLQNSHDVLISRRGLLANEDWKIGGGRGDEAGNSPSITSVYGAEFLKSFNGGRFPIDSVRTKWRGEGSTASFALTAHLTLAMVSDGIEIEEGTWLQGELVNGRVFKKTFQ